MKTGHYKNENYQQSAQIAAALQPAMRYNLLYRLASALGLQIEGESMLQRSIHTGSTPDHLKLMIDGLNDWRNQLRKVVDAFEISLEDKDGQDIFDGSAPMLANGVVADNICALIRARRHQRQSAQSLIKANLYLVAFMMTWHMTVCRPCSF